MPSCYTPVGERESQIYTALKPGTHFERPEAESTAADRDSYYTILKDHPINQRTQVDDSIYNYPAARVPMKRDSLNYLTTSI